MEEIILDKDCYPKLFRILRSKFPLLGKNEVAELIDKTRENNGGTLSGLKVVEVFTSIENTLTERQNIENKKSKDERTCKVCYKWFTYKKTCMRHMKKEHGNFDAAGGKLTKNTLVFRIRMKNVFKISIILAKGGTHSCCQSLNHVA